jgi:histidinol-phosphate aminotransferase
MMNRRKWLQGAGIASVATLLGGPTALQAKTVPLYRERLILEGMPIRLSANENPYGPSPVVRKAIENAFDVACRYPGADRNRLLEKIAKKEGLSTDHIVITGGSTEGLKVTGLTFGLDSGEIIAAAPTFKALFGYAQQFGAHIHEVPVREDLQHDLPEMERRITNRTSLVFICNPNNPTGTLLPADEFTDFCKRVSKRTVVFSDEAYADFITEPDYPSMASLVKQGHNVIVSRTFSKVYGLAGVRIGYLVARPDIAARLIRNRVAYTNVLALHAAEAALEDQAFYDFSIEQNMAAKKMIYKTLDDLGLEYQPSHTNFVFFKTGRPIVTLNEQMRDKGVLVGRPFPPLTDWCRISTGTIEEVKRFNQALKEVMS